MQWIRSSLAMVCPMTLLAFADSFGSPAMAQSAPAALFTLVLQDGEEDAEAARDRAIQERFLAVLENNPRRGTALDRVYGHHIERGTIEQLVGSYQGRVEKNPADATAWLILGMIEAKRGRDAAAVAALKQAETHDAGNPLASYYLAQALVLVGSNDQAIQALERARTRKPEPHDLVEISKMLGRLHQRAQRRDEALKVWQQLQEQFPDDLRVQEEIALTLAEEDQYADALKWYESLVEKSKDDVYRQVRFRMEAAKLKVRLSRTKDALADYEDLLSQLKPGSWLFADVRRNIEAVFLKSYDYAGLIEYYEKWLSGHEDDVHAMARLGRLLSDQGRMADAHGWLAKAVERAPSDKALRLALIDYLVQDERVADAIKQFEELDRIDKNNPDIIHRWGQLILEDKSRPEKERPAAATAVWERLAEARGDDPVVTAQLADIFRLAKMEEKAIHWYTRATELAPDDPQYHEYLGEYYHVLKRSDDALSAWQQIVAGDRRNAENLTRLSEVLAAFGYIEQAVEAIGESVELEGDDLNRRLAYIDLLVRAERFEEGLAQCKAAGELARTEEEQDAVLMREISGYQRTDRLAARIEELSGQLEAEPPTAAGYRRLALYLEADGRTSQATRTIKRAVELDEKSIPVLVAAARVYAGANLLADAARTNRKLADLDPRFRTQHLMEVSRLEMRLGRPEEAIAAAKQLIASAPGNPDHYQYFASLCFQLGRQDEGLDALRRSVRANPTEIDPLLRLASALTDAFRSDEAIELYWRAFEKADDLDSRLPIASSLAELHLAIGRFDQLVERLERTRREPELRRELTVCLAQVHRAAGDLVSARSELEQLMTAESRDSQLIEELAKLAAEEQDYVAAAEYQRRLIDAAPSPEAREQLARYHLASGAISEAEAIWVLLAEQKDDPKRALGSIDSLLVQRKYETALTVTERLLREQPTQWEFLYREAVALLQLKRTDDAQSRFQQLLAQNTDPDQKSVLQAPSRSPSGQRPGSTRPSQSIHPASRSQSRMQVVEAIKAVTGIGGEDSYNRFWQFAPGRYRSASSMVRASSYNPQGFASSGAWGPPDYATARIAAYGWLYEMARREKREDAFLESLREAYSSDDTPAHVLWDYYYVASMLGDREGVFDITRRLARRDETEAKWVFLTTVSQRNLGQQSNQSPQGPSVPAGTPLSDDDLQLLTECYDALRSERPDSINSQIVMNIAAELKRAGRADEEERFYRETLASAETPVQIGQVFPIVVGRGEVDETVALIDKMEKGARTGSSPGFPSGRVVDSVAHWVSQLMSRRASEDSYEDVLRLLDKCLEIGRRDSRRLLASASHTRRPARHRHQQRVYIQSFGGTGSRSIQLDYPKPNAYFSQGAIQLLRTALDHYQRADLVSDLQTHMEASFAALNDDEKIYGHLALSCLSWWTEERSQATEHLRQAVEMSARDRDLTFQLAELYELAEDPREALAVVEGIEANDHATLRERELLSLRLAVLDGNGSRARQAAERLFGLQLDTQTRTQLAGQMRQLGMHQMAEAVLRRAQRRSGNRAEDLLALMHHYTAQGEEERATEFALQVVRHGAAPQSLGRYDANRRQAIQFLGGAGKLEGLIKQLEDQLKRSPRNTRLKIQLAEYYDASNKKEESVALYEQMANDQPDDAKMRFAIGQQLEQSGNRADAIPHYLAAIRIQPQVMRNEYWRVLNACRSEKKLGEFVKLFDDIEIADLGGYWIAAQVVRTILSDESQSEFGIKLFRQAWETYPRERQQLIQSLPKGAVDKLPDFYQYAKVAIIPVESQSHVGPFSGVDQIYSWSGDGTVTSLAGRLLDATKEQNKFDGLRQEVASAVEKFPAWSGGKVLLMLIEAERGHTKEAKKMADTFLADKKQLETVPLNTCWVIAGILEQHEDLVPTAVRLYEGAMDRALESGNLNFSYSPLKRLVKHYVDSDRKADARRLMLRISEAKTSQSHYDPSYQAYQRVENVRGLAEEFLKLDLAADAARLLAPVIDDEALLEMAERRSGSWLTDRLRKTAEQAFNDLNAESLHVMLSDLVDAASPDKPADRALDLMLIVRPREFHSARVVCLVEQAVEASGIAQPVTAELRSVVQTLASARQDDLDIQVLAALLAIRAGQREVAEQSIARLAQWVSDHPLETLPPGGRANARQRAEAQAQLPLWLVARACWRHDELGELGDPLGKRAIEAASRMKDPLWLVAMYRQRGELAIDRADPEAARAAWRELLNYALTAYGDKGTGESKTARSMTADHCLFVLEMAKLAAKEGLVDLSFDAVQRALAAGPPLAPIARSDRTSTGLVVGAAATPSFGSGNTGAQSSNPVESQVEQALVEIAWEWRKKNVPAGSAYEVLAKVVMPASRPGEVFLYPRKFDELYMQKPRSVGEALCTWAVRAGQGAALRERIEGYAAKESTALPARVLQVQLDLLDGRFDAAGKGLQALLAQVKQKKLAYTAETVLHAGVPALDHDAVARDALALMDESVKVLAREKTFQPHYSALAAVARHYIARGQTDEAAKQLSQVLIRTAIRGDSGEKIISAIMLYARQRADQVFRLYAQQFDRAMKQQVDTGGIETERGGAFGLCVRTLYDMPADERYEFFKSFVMTKEGVDLVRYTGAVIPHNDIPIAILPPKEDPEVYQSRWVSREAGLFNTAMVLLNAAKEANQVDDLIQVIDAAAERKWFNAEEMKFFCDLALDRDPAAKQKLVERLAKLRGKWTEKQARVTRVPIFDFYLAQLCTRDPELCDYSEQIGQIHHRTSRYPLFLAYLHRESGLAAITRERAQNVRAGGDPGLALWNPASHQNFSIHQAGTVRPWWVAQDGYVAHVAGPYEDHLYFRYPLTGSFEFSVDGFKGEYATSDIGFAGRSVHWWPDNPEDVSIKSVGEHERELKKLDAAKEAEREIFYRLTVRVEPKRVEYLVDDRLVYVDDDPSPTSPWLSLRVHAADHAVYRNLRFTGTPVIPTEIKLADGDRLDGWISTFYLEQQPVRRGAPYWPTVTGGGSVVPRPVYREGEHDWWAADGVIYGRRDLSYAGAFPVESRFYYHRPMADGESIAYEFFHIPDTSMVHPALDRMAFLLDPKGVRLHWMTDGADYEWSDLMPDNAIDDPAGQRGPDSLPLKAGQWNAMQITLQDGIVTLTLNGVDIYQRTMEPENNRLFGLFHYKDKTEVMVRNVVLRGDWPTELTDDQMAHPLELSGTDLPLADRRARRRIIGEGFFSTEAGDLLARTRDLASDERYEQLLAWVFPDEQRDAVRLAGVDAAEGHGDKREAYTLDVSSQNGQSQSIRGLRTRVEAPVIDLVQVAADSGKLSELKERLDRLNLNDSAYGQRAQLAIDVLMALAEDRAEDAATGLDDLVPLVETIPFDTPIWQRWPMLVAASEGMKHAASLEAARKLLAALHTQCEEQNVPHRWPNLVQGLYNVASAQ